MAIDMKEFPNIIIRGLRADKKYHRFYYQVRVGTVRKRGIIDYSNKTWTQKQRKDKAIEERKAIADKIRARTATGQMQALLDAGVDPTLNDMAEIYFKIKLKGNIYADRIKRRYTLYCNNEAHPDKGAEYAKEYPEFNKLGKIKIDKLLIIDLDALKNAMETKGYTKQTKNGCSTRTIKEVFQQVITPILEYAKENNVIEKYPVIKFEKQKKKNTKKVTEPKKKLVSLFVAINDIFKDDPYYRALFLLAFYGRRFGEIRTLHWEQIDLENNTYTILAEHCKIGEEQKYDLPHPLRAALLQIPDDRDGLVFKSTKSKDGMITTPKRQLAHIKKASGVGELTMHYFRHILVSAMGEAGVVGTVLSASLGHTDLDTVNDYYLTASHTEASKTANEAIGEIIK